MCSSDLTRQVFATPTDSGSALLAGAFAIVAAATAYLAAKGPVISAPVLALGALGLLLAFVLARRPGRKRRVWIEDAAVHIDDRGSRRTFDLGSPHTAIEVHGTPGQRGWEVHFVRRSLPPYVLDATMVDGEEFMTALRRLRPEL